LIKRTALVVLAALAMGAWAVAADLDQFDAFFATAKGDRLSDRGPVQEGTVVYVAVQGTGRYCGMDKFPADILIFDFKTGAYIEAEDVWFRELGGPSSGLFFWVMDENSSVKVGVPLGSRSDFSTVSGQVHVLGVGPDDVDLIPALTDIQWTDGNWFYDADGSRIQADGEYGHLENMDTVILIVRDKSDPTGRVIDQDQIKIADTVSKLTVTPAVIDYGCRGCPNINITVVDPDENLNCNEIEYVPVFVIINPGSWNPAQTPAINNFCSLMRYGGHDEEGYPLGDPIRWYNIYDERYLDYADADTDSGAPLWWPAGAPTTILAVVFVPEDGPASGTFSLNLGSLEDFQEYLWGDDPEARNYKFPKGTTFSFYYIDPNDFDDMDLAWFRVAYDESVYSKTKIVDSAGAIVDTVKLGWDGLYIRVFDADANVEACCCDQVVVHICDPHNEDDSEYVILDEVSPNSGGVFASLAAVPLLPVWDAVAGFQLVFDDWRVQAFNEDTIFVQYNSVDYNPDDLNTLGDGDDSDFPPRIYFVDGKPRGRYQYWDVSFAKVKVFDTQVFDGRTHKMYFVDCAGNKILQDRLPMSANVGIVVEDPDQNEEPRLRELISWKWDAQEGSDPLLNNAGDGVLADFLGLLDNSMDGNSISGKTIPMKIFVVNASNGEWEPLTLRETQPGSGIFRSTTCVLLTGSAILGHDEGTLKANPGDTIMAFYQDPSNHSDISIIQIKVSEGGAGGVTPPTAALFVAFDKATYYPGNTVTITVTDEQYSGAAEIVGPKIGVLLDNDGGLITSWDKLKAVASQPGRFQVSYVLPETVKLGTITAKYMDPSMPTRTAQAQATVTKAFEKVTGITVTPNPFKTLTAFVIQGEPAGAVASKIRITIYDLTGARVAELSGTNTASVTWDGGNLRNGAYIYVAQVESAGKVFGRFKGFVYIER
jgi:hypothetical protein